MNNPTRLIWSTWPPRCVWSGVFFFGSLNLKGPPLINHFFKSNWNRMKLSCLTYFHMFCSVSSCLAMFGFSCALRQHLEKPLGAEVGAHLNRCPAMLSDSSLRQQRGLVEKTPQVSENAMRQPCRKWCRSGKKTPPFCQHWRWIRKTISSFCC